MLTTPSPTDTEATTILNVDDSEPIRYSRSRILINAGYRVIEAGTGEEALDLVVTRKPQLIVIDVNLPGMDGLEVCRIVKNDAATKHIMVLQMSAARGTAMDRAVGLDCGADAYLVEPVEPVELTATVRALLRLAQSEEQMRKFAGELEQLVAERTQELVQSQERLRGLATELNLVEHRERKRLASDLHDYLAQLLVLAKMKLAQSKPLAEQAPGCAEFINQADKVISDALTYTQTMVTELIPPYLHEFGLPTALRWLGDRMAQQALAVTVQIEDDDFSLPEDQAVLLFQSVRELLINSAKYAQAGQAMVWLKQKDGRLQIAVSDKGVGFNPAAPASNALTPLSSKFGLFSIRERMKALGGWFDLQSAPGQGTTATLVLPLERLVNKSEIFEVESAPRGPRVAAMHPTHRKESRTRVVLVDDHAMMRQGLRGMLESYPDVKVVGEAWNGEEAVACVEELRPAIVVMDIHMPKLNGIEATALIKSRYPDTIVIGLSVNANVVDREAMKRAGAMMLLPKEAAVEELYRAIQQALDTGHRIEHDRNRIAT